MQPAMHQPGFRLLDIFEQDFRDRLFRALSLGEVSALECTSRRSRQDLRQSALWERSACRQLLPRFRLPCPAPSTSETRKAICQVVAGLRKAKVPRDTRPVTLGNFKLAQELAACSARAQRVAARHRAEHGGFAEIVIANFRFGRGASLTDVDTMHISDTIVTSFLLGGVQQVWELRLAVDSGKVLLGSNRRGGAKPPAAAGQSPGGQEEECQRVVDDDRAFLVDIHCVSDTFKIHLFDMIIQPTSNWTRGEGLVSVRESGKADQSAALRKGLLCVLCLRTVPSLQAMRRPYRSLNSMNLECPSQLVL